MNALSFTTERGLYDRLEIMLLVDGVPIHHLIDPTDTSTDGAIPAWILTNGLPACDSNGWLTAMDRPGVQLVGPIGTLASACGCGEPGCGHIRCDVRRDADTVIFENFISARNHERFDVRFTFSCRELDGVVAEIAEIARREGTVVQPP